MDNTCTVTRAQMDDTRASLSEKLHLLERRVVDTAHGATDTVNTIQETVANVKDVFDLRHRVDRHPWAMVGGSIALGFLGGYLLVRRGATQLAANGHSPRAPLAATLQNGQGFRVADDASSRADPNPAQGAAEPIRGSRANRPFGTEMALLKKLAIGTVLSIVRDVITNSAPQSLQGGLAEVIDGVTVQMGGEPIRGPVLKTAATTT
jgi:ElaB/YqjD/DUF883 family membrane-anchored ribosome-binding protein